MGYADVADQSADDLVQDITKPQEESFDYKYYSGASKGPSPYDATHWIGPEGYLCPSDVDYAKITRAVNVEGYGYGHYNYTQTTRLETCLTPDSACRLLAPLLPVQVHPEVRLPQDALRRPLRPLQGLLHRHLQAAQCLLLPRPLDIPNHPINFLFSQNPPNQPKDSTTNRD